MSIFNDETEWEINFMLRREADAAAEHERVLEVLRSGMNGDVLLPEGDPDEIDDYENCPEPAGPDDACEHGFYLATGVRSGIWYHLNDDLCLWEICDEDVDVERWAREGRPTTQPIDGMGD